MVKYQKKGIAVMSCEKSCKNCIEMKRGECIGRKNICEFYRYSPPVTEEIKRTWPEYGDATAIRLGKPRR